MTSMYWYVIGGVLIATALISWIMDRTDHSGQPVRATVKKIANRDNHDGGYLTHLERVQTFSFLYGGQPVEVEEKRSGLLFHEGEEVDLLYNPKKKAVYYPGENRFNPMSIVVLILLGLVCFVGGLTFDQNQPVVAYAAAAAMVICALMRAMSYWLAMKPANAVDCRVTGIFRREDKKGTRYFPVYELNYRGRDRRVVRSYPGTPDRRTVGNVDTLHIDPWTSDFAEGEKEFNRLLAGLFLTLAVAFVLVGLRLSIVPITLPGA